MSVLDFNERKAKAKFEAALKDWNTAMGFSDEVRSLLIANTPKNRKKLQEEERARANKRVIQGLSTNGFSSFDEDDF